ncbi:MAG: o-succinylbenzoate synthase [Anaerolineae bacterium]|nr:o-succinylbenzoate synthase [Anaerolineae bacterium]
MKIERITLYHTEMELVEKLVTSFGGEALRPSIIVRIDAEGLTSWGEAVAHDVPDYSGETTGTVWHILRDHFGPRVVGQKIESVEEVRALLGVYRGNPMARAAVEGAVWDLLAQAAGQPLADYLHAGRYAEPRRKAVKVGVSIGIQESIAATLAIIEKRLAEGYPRIKLKIKPGWDVQLAEAVRARYPDISLMLDANSAYKLDDAARLAELDRFNLLMLEQPLWEDDIWCHSKLQPQIKSSICLDESIHTARDAAFALEVGACRIINVKPGRVGGFYEGRAIHDVCLKASAPAWVGGMLETGIGRAGNLAMASLPGFTLPGDISATSRYWEHDITGHYTLNTDGTIDVPDKPGLGAVIDHDRLEAVTTMRAAVVPRSSEGF